ncbi:MAG: mercury resistance system transport protein MerF [Rhodospirillales bacterium]
MKLPLIGTGATGTVFTGLCCVTPLLPWLAGALGLGAYLDYVYRDSVLLPALGFFVLMTGYGIWRRKRTHRS